MFCPNKVIGKNSRINNSFFINGGFNTQIYKIKKVKLYNLTCKAPLVGYRSNRFWKDLKKFKD